MKKTVADLIQYLKTKDQDKPIVCVYDGMFHDLYIFEAHDLLVFSSDNRDTTYEEVKVEFKGNAE